MYFPTTYEDLENEPINKYPSTGTDYHVFEGAKLSRCFMFRWTAAEGVRSSLFQLAVDYEILEMRRSESNFTKSLFLFLENQMYLSLFRR